MLGERHLQRAPMMVPCTPRQLYNLESVLVAYAQGIQLLGSRHVYMYMYLEFVAALTWTEDGRGERL